jgi:spore coat protein SA
VLVGEADQSAVANWYRQADLAAVPSLLPESFSYTCAQAMAAGVPVVASRIGGIPETLDYGASGMLVEPGSSEELARAIIHLAENPRLREALGRAGRTRAANLFATSRVTAQTALFYASVARTELAAEAQPVQ